MSFALLFVCTGNVCRSPMAERLFRARLYDSAPIVTSSAGVAGMVGYPMDGLSAAVLRELGGDPDGHAGRRLAPEQLADADLILTAETSHRSAIVRSDPLGFRRVFTLREFGRLGVGLAIPTEPPTAETLRARVAAVAARRGAEASVDQHIDDIRDPFGAPIKAARLTAAQISEAVDQVLAVLALKQRGTDF